MSSVQNQVSLSPFLCPKVTSNTFFAVSVITTAILIQPSSNSPHHPEPVSATTQHLLITCSLQLHVQWSMLQYNISQLSPFTAHRRYIQSLLSLHFPALSLLSNMPSPSPLPLSFANSSKSFHWHKHDIQDNLLFFFITFLLFTFCHKV